MNRLRFNYVKMAPDGGAGGGEEVVVDNFAQGFISGGEEEELFLVDGLDDIPTFEEVPQETEEMRLLREQNELLQRQIADLQVKADTANSLQEGIAQLGQTLRTPVPQMASPAPVVDPVKEKEDFNKDFMDDPYEALNKFQMQKLAPELQRTLNVNAQYSKQFLMLDPKRKGVYDKYGQEVEQVFSQLPPAKRLQDPNAYKEAADLVAARHLDETEAEMTERITAQVLEQLKKDGTIPGGKETPKTTVHSEAGRSGVNVTTKPKVLPSAVWAEAAKKGLQGRGDADDKKRIYDMWSRGILKVPGHEFKG